MLALSSPFESTAAIVIFAVECLGIICAWRALMHTRTAQGATAWIVSLVLQPFLALPMYAVFGRRKFVGYRKARQGKNKRLGPIAEQLRVTLANQANADSPRLDTLERLAGLPFTKDNRAELLINGPATFDSIFEGMAKAKHYLLIQFFIVRDDQLGRKFRDHLLARAREGLRVMFLFDEIGSYSLPSGYIDELRAGGVDMRSFHTTRGRKNRFQVNFRNHRKVVIADGHVAWVGGANLGDEYMGRDPKIGPWRDTHLRLEGPATLGVQLGFLEDWHWATQQIPPLNWAPIQLLGAQAEALALPSGPADAVETAELFFLHMINSAKERIWITSPYFVPDNAVVQALKLAVMRDVDVRVLLPSKADHLLVYLSSFSYLEELCSTGVRVFRYRPGFLHQKVLLVDRDLASVSTANLDNRSFRLNFELTLVIHHQEFNHSVEAMLLTDFTVSDELDLGHIQDRSLLFRSAVKLARLAAPIQ